MVLRDGAGGDAAAWCAVLCVVCCMCVVSCALRVVCCEL
jgi:hypothetical protein